MKDMYTLDEARIAFIRSGLRLLCCPSLTQDEELRAVLEIGPPNTARVRRATRVVDEYLDLVAALFELGFQSQIEDELAGVNSLLGVEGRAGSSGVIASVLPGDGPSYDCLAA